MNGGNAGKLASPGSERARRRWLLPAPEPIPSWLDAEAIDLDEVPYAPSLVVLRRVLDVVVERADGRSVREPTMPLFELRAYLAAAMMSGWVRVGAGGRIEPSEQGRALVRCPPLSLEEAEALAAGIAESALLRSMVGSYLADERIERQMLVKRLAFTTGANAKAAGLRAEALLSWRGQLLERGWKPTPARGEDAASFDLPVEMLPITVLHRLRASGVRSSDELSRVARDDDALAQYLSPSARHKVVSWAVQHGIREDPDRAAAAEWLRATTQAVDESRTLHARVPTVLLLELSALSLSKRARRVLRWADLRRLGDLVTADPELLLCVPSCGRKTVEELATVASRYGYRLGTNVAGWSRADRLEKLALTAKPRRAAPSEVYALDSSRGVEIEIASALLVVLGNPALADRVQRWIGLHEAVAPTLLQAGKPSGVTRERVRQLVRKVRQGCSGLEMVRLAGAVQQIERASASCGDAVVLEQLRAEGYVEGSATIRGILRAADLFGVAVRTDIQTRRDHDRRQASSALRSVLPFARRACARWGCSTVEDIASEVSEHFGWEVSIDEVADVLAQDPDFRWLDEDNGWFWLVGPLLQRNRLLYRVDKVLAVARRVELSRVRDGIVRDDAMEGYAPPLSVLRALCEQLEDCSVEGGGIIVDERPRRPTEVLSPVEIALWRVALEHGPVLPRSVLFAGGLASGANQNSCRRAISFSPIFRDVAQDAYALVGVDVTAAELELASDRPRRVR